MSEEIRVSSDNDGRRLDRILRNMFPGVPLGAIMKAIRLKEVRLDSRKTTGNARVSEGQIITVPWDSGEIKDVPVTNRRFGKLPTLLRTDFIWIINKPAGLLTQPDSKGGDSLITRVLSELSWSRKDFRPSTVQRLDRNTSGIVMVAMNGKAHRVLNELIREREIKKIYTAVVCGRLRGSGEITLPLSKDRKRNVVKADTKGRPAETRYFNAREAGGFTVVELELITGRSHQARVHLASIGHPIAGDIKYGGKTDRARRPLLHACRVEFLRSPMLPAELSGASVTAPLPRDMEVFTDEV